MEIRTLRRIGFTVSPIEGAQLRISYTEYESVFLEGGGVSSENCNL